jgi:tetraacyldisaccharide 4'-kinase
MNEFWIRRVWDHKDLLGRLLWLLVLPFSLLYWLAVRILDLLYSLGWMRTRSLPRAVVSVGNLTVGGTGKTPATLWLAAELSQRGYKVAILSRGYKRKGKGIRILGPRSNHPESIGKEDPSDDAGDEPAMMASIYGQRVGVGRKRHEAGSQLLRAAEVDIFLLDDGFQHRQLRRDLDLLLLGSDWTGWLIPAGPFREPRGALGRASLYLITGARERWELVLDGYPKQTIFFGALEATGLFTLDGKQWKQYPLSLLDRKKILTVSAISDPACFYRMIQDWEGEIVDTIEFPDHHTYSAQDWQRINRAARRAELVVTTEKDILKLMRFPFPKEKLLALRVEMTVENRSPLIQAVEDLVKAKRGSSH